MSDDASEGRSGDVDGGEGRAGDVDGGEGRAGDADEDEGRVGGVDDGKDRTGTVDDGEGRRAVTDDSVRTADDVNPDEGTPSVRPATVTPATRVTWRWHPLARILFYCGTLLLLSQLTILVVLLIYLGLQGEVGSVQERLQEVSESPSAGLLLGAYVIVGPIVFLWTAFFRRRVDLRSFASLGFEGAHRLRSLLTGTAIGLLAPGVVVIPGLLTGAYRWGAEAASDSPGAVGASNALIDAGPTAPFTFLLIFAGFLVQSASEELALRGYVQRNMVEWKAASRNLVWILIVPSLLFSLLHGFNPDYSAVASVNTVLIGVLFGAVVLANGNLWSAIGLHGGWNFGLGCLWSLPVSGLSTPHLFEMKTNETGSLATFLFGGDYGPEGGLLVSLLALGGIVWALPRAMAAWQLNQWRTHADTVP